MSLRCKDCQDRYINCHATCEDYQKFKKEREELRKEKYKKSRLGLFEQDMRKKRNKERHLRKR